MSIATGIVGLGFWGDALAQRAESAGLTVASVYSRDTQARRDFAGRYGASAASSWEDLLSDENLEAVLIATPHTTHVDMALEAAASGKHVFVEKPLALSVADGSRMIRAAKEAGVILQVGHNRRRQPAVRRLKALIDGGDLGDVHLAEANLSNAKGLQTPPNWKSRRDENPAGGMAAMGVHMVDSLNFLLGRVRSVAALSGARRSDTNVDDVTVAVLEYESGAIAHLSTSRVIPPTSRIALFGSAGGVISEMDGALLFRQGIEQAERTGEPIEVIDTVQDELREFARCIRSGEQPEVTGEVGLAVVEVLEAILTSIDERRTVRLMED